MTDRWKRLAPMSGVIAVGLIVAVLTIPGAPDSGASGAKVIAFAKSHKTSITVSALMLAYAGTLVLLYFSSLASYLRKRGSDQLATLTVVGAAVFAVGAALAGGLAATLADSPGKMSTSAAQAINMLQNDAWVAVLFAGLGIATLSAGVGMLRTHAMPKALGIITIVVGGVAMTGIGAWFAFLGSGPLVLVTAGFLYQRLGRPEEITIPEVPQPRAKADTESPARTAVKNS
jgi:hypothetical protein